MSEDTTPSANGHVEPDESDSPDTCFVIAPLGDKPSETRKRTNGLLDEAIRPVVEHKLGLEVVAPHEIAEAGSITRQVIQRLLDAELVVADLTDLNPNVMYEMAVRHAKGRPVVPIAQEGTALPFDITTERTLFYEESFHGLNELKPKLEDAARAALSDGEPDNPIYRAQQDFQMREAAADDDAMQYVMNRLDDIESSVRSSSRGDGARTTGLSRTAKEFVPIDVDGLSTEELDSIMTRVRDAHGMYGLTYETNLIESKDGTTHLTLLVPDLTIDETEKIVEEEVGKSRYEMM